MNDNLSLLSSFRDFALSYLWRRLSDMWVFWLFIKKLGSSFRDFVISQLWRRLSDIWLFIKTKKSFFYLAFFVVFSGVLIWLERKLELNVSADALSNLASTIGSIIGASIPIALSFSSSISNNTADVFSSRLPDSFAEDSKEKLALGGLALLTIASFSISVFPPKYSLAYLLIFFLSALYIVCGLYLELKDRKNPNTFLEKIKVDAVEKLEKMREKYARMPDNIPENKEKIGVSNPALSHVKYLHEVGLKLLAKNEIYSFNLAIQYIQDIYLKHLELGSNYFIRRPSSIWGAYDCDDEGVTAQTFECLQSMGERAIEEKRKENIFALLHVYHNIIERALCIKYADDIQEEKNPLLGGSLLYYRKFIEALLASKEGDWILGVTSSLSNISKTAIQKTDDYYVFSQIHEMMSLVPDRCLNETREACLFQLADTYFDQIKWAWNKRGGIDFFWGKLFQGLENVVLLLSPSLGGGSMLGDLFIKFHLWQGVSAGKILNLRHGEEQKKDLSDFVALLEKWSGFLLNFASKNGLNTSAGFFIVYSVRSNLKTIFQIRNGSQRPEGMREIYQIQIDIFSWYFRNTEKLDSHLHNLNHVLEDLLQEICNNLKDDFFDVKYLINQYVGLIEQHFNKASFGFGFNHPRIIQKLVYLGLLLNKYEKDEEVAKILSKMDELNNKYLEFGKKSFNQVIGQLVIGPSEFQLCEEIHDLGKELDSIHRHPSNDLNKILLTEITKKDWDNFVKKISYCNGYDLTDLSPDIFKEEGFGSE